MAIVQGVIDRAARLLGQIEPNTSLDADESADALVALNDLIDSWRNEELLVYARQEESLTLVSAQGSYTIGPGGDLGTTRPVRIESAYVLDGVNSYPNISIIEDDEYDAIPNKTSQSTWPDRINYRPTMPAGTLYVFPVPNAASVLKLMTWTVLAEFSGLTDTISLPPGFRKALTANLALELAPEYETEVSQSLLKMATESKASIKRINSRPIKAYTELPRLIGRQRSNIITGL